MRVMLHDAYSRLLVARPHIQALVCQVRLDMGLVPTLPGAMECVAKGIMSSLQPANLRLKRGICNEAEAMQHEVYPLLFDPQTAGGLLASVPADRVDECICKLKELGYPDTTVIGQVVEVDTTSHMRVECNPH